jgi:ribosomal-protein-alanine N-acetyltransferase
MTQLNFKPFPILETRRLILRELVAEDSDSMHVLRSNKQVMRFIPRPMTRDVNEAGQLVELIREKLERKEAINWAIVLKETGAHIGMIGYLNFVNENYRAEIGYLLHPAYHRMGLTQEALTCALKYGFETMNLHSIVAIVQPENMASSCLLMKCGFVLEGSFRDYQFFDGHFLDVQAYCLLEPK